MFRRVATAPCSRANPHTQLRKGTHHSLASWGWRQGGLVQLATIAWPPPCTHTTCVACGVRRASCGARQRHMMRYMPCGSPRVLPSIVLLSPALDCQGSSARAHPHWLTHACGCVRYEHTRSGGRSPACSSGSPCAPTTSPPSSLTYKEISMQCCCVVVFFFVLLPALRPHAAGPPYRAILAAACKGLQSHNK